MPASLVDATTLRVRPMPERPLLATGGVRKIRWGRRGTGKRGGVIYFYHDPAMPLYLLMIYAKARRDDLSRMRGGWYTGLWRT
ncbi:MAG: hypothetical protein JOZ17_27655 [Acetobacteraceae bacterium]|nr:hypothetical protein [Acetobacteraceae bacterium]